MKMKKIKNFDLKSYLKKQGSFVDKLLKKYLPKESSFENSKALRKYKYLIKPNNLNKYNYYSSRNNYGG